MENISFENLPFAVSKLLETVTNIESLLLENGNKKEQANPNSLLTVPQAAEFLSLIVPTVYSMISKGILPCMKRSKRVYFTRHELLTYLKDGKKKTLDKIAIEAGTCIKKKSTHKK